APARGAEAGTPPTPGGPPSAFRCRTAWRPIGREPRQSSHEAVEIPYWLLGGLPPIVVVVLLPVLEAFVVGFARGGLVGGHDLLVHLLPSVDLSVVHQPVHARQDDAGDLVTAGLLLRRRGP